MWKLILFKNTVKMVFCDQKYDFLPHNPWGRRIDNGRKDKVFVGEFEMREIDNEWILQRVR